MYSTAFEDEHLTDLGNARRLVRMYGKRLRYIPEWGTWLIWRGVVWERDRTGHIERMAKDVARRMHQDALNLPDRDQAAKLSKHAYRSESESRIRAMIALARTEPDIPVLPEELDADPWAFNVENGTVDLKTGVVRTHAPSDMITKLAPVTYDPNATAEMFETFLMEIMAGHIELVRFLQRAVGYSMTGRVDEHVLIFLHGLGANGKSTLLNVLLRLFGGYGRSSEPELLIRRRGDAHPTGVADLKGARLVSTSEIDAGRHLAESLVKQLTGGDRIKARYMRQDFFEFTPSHTLWLMANHRPVVKGTDIAIWRRILLVPFDVTIPNEQQDGELGEKLEAELPGVLNWALHGCLEWQRKGLAPPDEVKAATQRYRADMDSLGDFLAEHCVIEADAVAEGRLLYEQYTIWAEKSGERRVAKNIFGRRLRERGFDTQQDPKTRRVVYQGIGLGKPSEATRSNLHVNGSRKSHVGRNAEVASHTFATGPVQ